MWGLWLSRGKCGIISTDMKTLRFICFASLLAILLFAGTADQGRAKAEIEDPGPPPWAVPPPISTPQKCGIILSERWVTVPSGAVDRLANYLITLNCEGSILAPLTISMTSKPTTPVDLAGNTTPENRQESEELGTSSSGIIMITMTTIGEPGEPIGERAKPW